MIKKGSLATLSVSSHKDHIHYSPVSTNALMKIVCLKFSWTRNSLLSLVETCTKLKKLIQAPIIKYGLTRVQLPLWLQRSLINGISWNGMSWAIVVNEHLYSVLRPHGITKSGRHSALKNHLLIPFFQQLCSISASFLLLLPVRCIKPPGSRVDT